MCRRITPRHLAGCLAVLALAALVGAGLSAQDGRGTKAGKKIARPESRLVVHKWGTFTSIAGGDGVALEWRPLNGPSDLPKFVHSFEAPDDGLRHPRKNKGDLRASVRMETPVLYFYSPGELDVSV